MKRIILPLLICLLGLQVLAQETIGFDSTVWALHKNATIQTLMKREVLQGSTYLKDVELANGTIEVDVYSTGERNFGGFMFHVQSFDSYEWCWLRMHKTNGLIQDGVQYAPIINGTSCWQLNGGKNGIAPVYLPKNEWVHLKLDIQDDTARLFVADMERPVLTMDNLQLDEPSGKIGIKGLWQTGLYFSNFSYKLRDRSMAHKQVEPKYEKDVISEWRLSQRYFINDFLETESYPDNKLGDTKDWLSPKVSNDGLINISRYYGHNPGNKKSCAILKTTIESTENQKAILAFGYSDAVTIFINGQGVFTGDRAYRSRNMAFGGWGFQAKIDNID